MSLRIKAAILAAAVLITMAGWKGLNALAESSPGPTTHHVLGDKTMVVKIHKTDEEWKALLAPLQYQVMFGQATEPPFSGAYNNHYEKGVYVCAACKTPLFSSQAKYDHGSGWPSFLAPIDEKNLEFRKDDSVFMNRIDVRCAVCGAHLGHVFDDGPAPTFEHYCINSAAMGFTPSAQEKGEEDKAAARPSDGPRAQTTSLTETATFAAGCFWGVEHKFGQLKGVRATTVGYTGGQTKDPTYSQVCTDRTGHAESIRVEFDPSLVSYEELVKFFFSIHDPTQEDRQGADLGPQYRSVIFYHSQAQKDAARKVMYEMAASGQYSKPIATGLVPASPFYPAEEYHQKYYEKNKIGACVR
jgi:peptide methionine sulfoxide reductase msrA/msrB